MINSLTELDEAIKKGQQFERKSFIPLGWKPIDVLSLRVVDLIRFIALGQLRVRQVKG